MARYPVGHASDCLDLEHGLRFRRQGQRRLEGVCNSMAAQDSEKLLRRRVMVNDNVGRGHMYAEPVGREVFSFTAEKGVEKERDILLAGVCERYLDDFGQLVRITVHEPSFEGAGLDGRRRDVGLDLGALEGLAALSLRRGRGDRCHGRDLARPRRL